MIEHIANAWGDLLVVLLIVFCKIDKLTLLNIKLINTLIKINIRNYINILKLKEIFLINLVSWLMGILNLVYCYLFLFVSLAVIQAIYIEMFFVKSQCQSPFPLSLESWHLLKVDRVYISFMFKSVNLSILQKTINKISKSPHAFAMCSIRTDLLKQENEKIDSL